MTAVVAVLALAQATSELGDPAPLPSLDTPAELAAAREDLG